MTSRPIAIVNDCRSPVSAVHQITFEKLAERFGKCEAGPKDGKGIVPAVIEVGPRTGERVNSISVLMLDVEADAEAVKGESGEALRDPHGDIIKRVIGQEPPAFDEMLAELSLHGWRCVINTTYSHGGAILPEGVEHPRYRLTFDLSRPLQPKEMRPLGLHLANLLGIADCFDSACLEPARLFYLPRCPAERLPLFRHGIVEGDPLPVDDLLTEAAKIEQAHKSALAGRHGQTSGNVIKAFNDAHDVGLMIEQHGYLPKGRNRWIWPGSTTGMPGVRKLPESESVYSSHGGDPLNDGKAHDAFDCWRILKHGGNMTAAVKEAARLLGMEGRRSDHSGTAKGEYRPGKDEATAGDSAQIRDDDETIIRLSRMSPLEYDRIRKAESEAMGVRPVTLDKMVAAARKSERDGGMEFDEVEPWPHTVEPALLLTEIASAVRRFIVCDRETADATALWAALTWFIDDVQVAPLAVITAPEKRCGKSQLLFVLGRMVQKPLAASNVSAAALFRAVDAWKPTLLVDEADAFMRENEELRGILNAGHTRDSAYVVRVVGEDLKPQRFSVWGCKAMAGIGHLADTLMDRAITLELRRKLPHETVERLRHAEPGLFDEIAAKLARFADDHRDAIRRARPALPAELHDRAQDNWEPLLAIADVAGGEWPELARRAALKLSGSDSPAMTTGTELLADIKTIFESKGFDRISTSDLIEALCADTEAPWATYNRGRPISPRQVSKRLSDYGIASHTIRIGVSTPKGYLLTAFDEAFSRYLSLSPLPSATPPQSSHGKGFHVADEKQSCGNINLSATPKPASIGRCGGVADTRRDSGDIEIVEVEI